MKKVCSDFFFVKVSGIDSATQINLVVIQNKEMFDISQGSLKKKVELMGKT